MRSRATILTGTAVRRIGLGPSQIQFDAWGPVPCRREPSTSTRAHRIESLYITAECSPVGTPLRLLSADNNSPDERNGMRRHGRVGGGAAGP